MSFKSLLITSFTSQRIKSYLSNHEKPKPVTIPQMFIPWFKCFLPICLVMIFAYEFACIAILSSTSRHDKKLFASTISILIAIGKTWINKLDFFILFQDFSVLAVWKFYELWMEFKSFCWSKQSLLFWEIAEEAKKVFNIKKVILIWIWILCNRTTEQRSWCPDNNIVWFGPRHFMIFSNMQPYQNFNKIPQNYILKNILWVS